VLSPYHFPSTMAGGGFWRFPRFPRSWIRVPEQNVIGVSEVVGMTSRLHDVSWIGFGLDCGGSDVPGFYVAC